MLSNGKSRGATDLSIYNNEWYQKEIGAGVFKRLTWYFINHLVFATPFFPVNGMKTGLLRLFGAKVGKGVVIKPGVNIKFPWQLRIGDYSWVGEGVWIDNLTMVDIGNNVCLSQGAMLLTGNHNFRKTTFDLTVKGIVLEDGVWIGAKAMVCPGVVCRTHAVLTVMSVAKSNLEPYMIYSGNPANQVKERIVEE